MGGTVPSPKTCRGRWSPSPPAMRPGARLQVPTAMACACQQWRHLACARQMLRLMALAYLKLENGVLALQCVQTQRTLPPRLSEQHSVPYQALQALLLLGRTQDAESELQAVISHQVCFHSACVDSSKALFSRN